MKARQEEKKDLARRSPPEQKRKSPPFSNSSEDSFLNEFDDFGDDVSLSNSNANSLSNSSMNHLPAPPNVAAYPNQGVGLRLPPQMASSISQGTYFSSNKSSSNSASSIKSSSGSSLLAKNETPISHATLSKRLSSDSGNYKGPVVRVSSGSLTYSDTQSTSKESSLLSNDPKKKNAEKRREERNIREQQRSSKITSQIDKLKSLLDEAGLKVNNSKYDILVGVEGYLAQLKTQLASKQRNAESSSSRKSDSGSRIVAEDSPNSFQSDEMVSLNNAMGSSSKHGDPFNSLASLYSDKNFRQYFMQSPKALALAETDGRIFDCNPAFEDVTGLRAEHVYHASIFKLVDPAYLQTTYLSIGVLLRSQSDKSSTSSDSDSSDTKQSDKSKRPRYESSSSRSTISSGSTSSKWRSTIHVKSLVVSAFDGTNLCMTIGLLNPSADSQNESARRCFSVALTPCET